MREIVGRLLQFWAVLSLAISAVAHAQLLPPPVNTTYQVDYLPTIKIIQGNQPLSSTYVLQIKSPANFPAGTTSNITLGLSVLASPVGVSDATALSLLSLSTSTLQFTAPSQTKNVTVSLNVPLGQYAGSYGYGITTQGWPTGILFDNNGAQVNATVLPPVTGGTGTPPAVVLQTPANGSVFYLDALATAPLSIPMQFEGTADDALYPITALAAKMNGQSLSVTSANLQTTVATGTSTLQIFTPGVYSLSVDATNQWGTSTDTGEFEVILVAPPPTVSPVTPVDGTVYTYDSYVGTPVSVPVNFTANSPYGPLNSISATLDGQPLTISTTGVGTSDATGTASLSYTTAGTHTLIYTAANDYGTATASVSFSVEVVDALPPHVDILTPDAGSVYTRVTGDPATQVSYTFAGGTDWGVIESYTVELDGTVITSTVDGVGTDVVSGSGVLEFSAEGTHVLTVTVSNGFGTASDQTTFTVVEESPQICANLCWLPPISLNKTIHGGSTIPIKFTLRCDCKFVRDENVVIAIYEIYCDNTTSAISLYPYGGANPNPPGYAINGNHYHLNYCTAEGNHHYRIEVYHSGSNGDLIQLLGSKDLFTSGRGGCVPPAEHCCDSHTGHDDHNGGCNDDDDDHHYGSYGDCRDDDDRDRCYSSYGSYDRCGDRDYDYSFNNCYYGSNERDRDCDRYDDRNEDRDCKYNYSSYNQKSYKTYSFNCGKKSSSSSSKSSVKSSSSKSSTCYVLRRR